MGLCGKGFCGRKIPRISFAVGFKRGTWFGTYTRDQTLPSSSLFTRNSGLTWPGQHPTDWEEKGNFSRYIYYFRVKKIKSKEKSFPLLLSIYMLNPPVIVLSLNPWHMPEATQQGPFPSS